MESPSATSVHAPAQYLLFRIARQHFAIDAARVHAILPAVELVPFETSHSWICGTAKVRGREFPIVDLRARMNLPRASQGRTPCLIVVRTFAGTSLAGFVADRVSRVETVHARDVRKGFAHTSGRVRRLLDPDQILSEDELLNFRRREPA